MQFICLYKSVTLALYPNEAGRIYANLKCNVTEIITRRIIYLYFRIPFVALGNSLRNGNMQIFRKIACHLNTFM
jgi:hypothetical protein